MFLIHRHDLTAAMTFTGFDWLKFQLLVDYRFCHPPLKYLQVKLSIFLRP
jgi:hypothetical protein